MRHLNVALPVIFNASYLAEISYSIYPKDYLSVFTLKSLFIHGKKSSGTINSKRLLKFVSRQFTLAN